MTDILTVKDLTHIYSVGTPFEKTAVVDVGFSVEKSEMIALIGQTGSGKSTLIQHLNGLLKPTKGTVTVSGEDIFSSKEMTRAARFAVGLVFQYPEYQLFEETVFKDISFGPRNMGLSEDEIKKRVYDSAHIVGIEDADMERSPFELSGGQRRRVAIAGVLAMEPQVLVLDEPAAGLDPAGKKAVMGYIKAYKEKHGTTVIFVTHSMEDAAENADRIIVMAHGTILMQGTPGEVFAHEKELLDAGLCVPQVTELVHELEKRGYDLPDNIYTVEQAVKAITALKEGAHK